MGGIIISYRNGVNLFVDNKSRVALYLHEKKKHRYLNRLLTIVKNRNKDRVVHGETGPDILDKMVHKYSLDKYVLHYDTFQSIDYDEIEKIFTSNVLKYELIGMHLCDSVWNEKGYTLDMAEKSSVMNYFIQKYGTES